MSYTTYTIFNKNHCVVNSRLSGWTWISKIYFFTILRNIISARYVCGTNISNNTYGGTDNSILGMFLTNNLRLIVLIAENCGNSNDYKIFSEIRGESPRVGI